MKKTILSLSLLSVAFAGCLKDKGFEDSRTGFNTPGKERFVTMMDAYETSGINTKSIMLTPAEEQLEYFTLSLTGAISTKDVTVSLAVNNQLVGDYNNANGTHYEALPPNTYELPGSVVISAGQEYLAVPLKLKKAGLLMVLPAV